MPLLRVWPLAGVLVPISGGLSILGGVRIFGPGEFSLIREPKFIDPLGFKNVY